MTIAELLAKLRIAPDKRSFDSADRMISMLKTALLGLVAVQTGRFFAGMVTDTIELGGKIDDLAQSTGQTREGLQELAFMGEQAGMTMDDTSGIVTKLSKNLYEAANGNKEMAKAFARAGIAVRGADGELRPAGDVLQDIGDLVSSMPDGTKKTALAMELLGKSGAKAIPLLNAGGEGMRKMAADAHELGAVMSEETIKSLDELGDEQAKVKAALVGLRNEAVAELLPVLKEMTAGLLEWVKANRKIIAQKLATVIRVIAGALKFLGKIVGYALDALDWMGKNIKFIELVVLSLAAALAILKVSSITAAIASGAAWALANLPLVLLAVLIGGVILLVEDIITAFQGGRSVIAEFFNKKFGGDFVDTMSRVAGGVKAAFTAVFDFLTEKVNWLIEKGEWLGQKLHDLVHGSDEFNSQFQKDYLKRMGLENVPGAAEGVFGDKDLSAIDGFTTAGAVPNVPKGGAGGGNNTFKAEFKIDGSKSPEETAKAVNTVLEQWWGVQMNKAAVGAGTR